MSVHNDAAGKNPQERGIGDPDHVGRPCLLPAPGTPRGYASWRDWLREKVIPQQQWNGASAAIDPGGNGPRLFFQRVPEGKAAKNRVHLDVNVGRDAVEPTLLRLVEQRPG